MTVEYDDDLRTALAELRPALPAPPVELFPPGLHRAEAAAVMARFQERRRRQNGLVAAGILVLALAASLHWSGGRSEPIEPVVAPPEDPTPPGLPVPAHDSILEDEALWAGSSPADRFARFDAVAADLRTGLSGAANQSQDDGGSRSPDLDAW